MVSKSTMKLTVVILFLANLSVHVLGDHGNCAKKCQPGTVQEDDQAGKRSGLHPFPCSCSSSCTLYKDCCYDSPYRNQVKKPSDRPSTICLSLSGRGQQYRVVSDCPKEWEQTSRFCTESVGHLPPVTSRTTGTTYANIHCASCHGEDSVDSWPVELRCCPEHNSFSERKYVYISGQMWSQVGDHKCLCRFEAHHDDYTFLNDHEVRTCDVQLEISKCSSSWRAPAVNNSRFVRKECYSFLEPVFIGEKVYRNRYCAQCNFKITDGAKCMPAVVELMASGGLSANEIFQFCLKNRYPDCVYYLSAAGRGKARKFSALFDISEQSCLPLEGSRCCEGEIYDYKRKVCRKLKKRRN
ncbi:hypothetical protein JTE90_012531 [Oedothorax gibbosus]|uniref:SMB domain-containing protein n=1 Tax=Oedothorax gibbosus TaxID=931172 RepID=A0AAV6U4C7_9ARAC|nr:hypothetical protein JTE90_012531 [Oedothorax gibbosus]